jgi:hypothetical protein
MFGMLILLFSAVISVSFSECTPFNSHLFSRPRFGSHHQPSFNRPRRTSLTAHNPPIPQLNMGRKHCRSQLRPPPCHNRHRFRAPPHLPYFLQSLHPPPHFRPLHRHPRHHRNATRPLLRNSREPLPYTPNRPRTRNLHHLFRGSPEF